MASTTTPRNAPPPPAGFVWPQDYVHPDGTVIPGIATRLGIAYATYRKWRMRGEGPPTIRVGGKRLAASIRSIEQYLADLERDAVAQFKREADIARHDMRPAEYRTAS